MNTIEVHIKGTAAHIQHNGQMADPLNPWTKIMRETTGKRKKTDADLEQMGEIEWHAGLYTKPAIHPDDISSKARVIVPARVIKACLLQGAKKSKNGTTFKTAAFVNGDPELIYKGPKEIKKLWADGGFMLRSLVVVNRARIVRCRPIFEDWELKFKVDYDPDLINKGTIEQILYDAGNVVGLSDWRPEHGKFVIVNVK